MIPQEADQTHIEYGYPVVEQCHRCQFPSLQQTQLSFATAITKLFSDAATTNVHTGVPPLRFHSSCMCPATKQNNRLHTTMSGCLNLIVD